MRTIAVVNQNGGTAKTTTSVSLGATLAERGRKVLLIDLDPQYSATTWLATHAVGRGVFDLFADPERTALVSLVHPTATEGLSLVGASAWLVGAEKALATEPGAETILREKLSQLPAGGFDYVLIDCPPTLGVLTVNALQAMIDRQNGGAAIGKQLLDLSDQMVTAQPVYSSLGAGRPAR